MKREKKAYAALEILEEIVRHDDELHQWSGADPADKAVKAVKKRQAAINRGRALLKILKK